MTRLRRGAISVAVILLSSLFGPVVGTAGAAAAPGFNSVSAFGTAARVVPGVGGPVGVAPVVGIAADRTHRGFWLAGRDGGVFTFGDAHFHGSAGHTYLYAPIVGIAASPTGNGYWLVASDGGVFSYGDARFHGSTGAIHLNQPIVGMAASPTGRGYWLVASDGGVFTFGDARFHGSTGAMHLNQPIVGMAASPTGRGYWLVASDGGVFTFGDARFHGSTGAMQLNRPVVGMAASPSGRGYWLVGADGGLFTFGDAPFKGSGGGVPGSAPAVGMAGIPGGYWIAYGKRTSPVPDIAAYAATRVDRITVSVQDLTTGLTYDYQPGLVEHTASTVKVDILATLLRQAQAAGRGLTAEEQSLAVPMIEQSLDSAANTLWVRLGAGAIAATEQAVGMVSTFPPNNGIWGTTTTTAADRLDMMRTLVFPNAILSDSSRTYILNLMEHITPSQDWGVTGGVPAGVTVALKNGFSQINGWQINSAGWVHGQGHNYVIAVLTDFNPSEGYGIETANAVSAIVWNALR